MGQAGEGQGTGQRDNCKTIATEGRRCTQVCLSVTACTLAHVYPGPFLVQQHLCMLACCADWSGSPAWRSPCPVCKQSSRTRSCGSQGRSARHQPIQRSCTPCQVPDSKGVMLADAGHCIASLRLSVLTQLTTAWAGHLGCAASRRACRALCPQSVAVTILRHGHGVDGTQRHGGGQRAGGRTQHAHAPSTAHTAQRSARSTAATALDCNLRRCQRTVAEPLAFLLVPPGDHHCLITDLGRTGTQAGERKVGPAPCAALNHWCDLAVSVVGAWGACLGSRRQHSMAQHGTAWHSTAQHGTARLPV